MGKQKTPSCLFCGEIENIKKHHVCWSRLNDGNEKRYKPRSWTASLTVPLCKDCRELYYKSSDKNEFISKIKNSEKQEIIRAKFDSAQLIIEDAIRLSYLLPLVNYRYCGKTYSYVKAIYPSLDDILIKLKDPFMPSHFWGKTTLWGIRTKNYLENRESEIYDRVSTKKNSKNYEIIREKITKLLLAHKQKNFRYSRNAITNYIISHNTNTKGDCKFDKSEIEYALCRMVANKELTIEIKREMGWVYYYRYIGIKDF